MDWIAAIAFLSLFTAIGVAAQAPCAPTTSKATPLPLAVQSNIVEVPALVTTKSGQVVFELTAQDFRLTDNGKLQHLDLVPDTDSQPLALTVVVETGGSGARHLGDYGHLEAILEALIGQTPHQVALVAFDSAPHVVVPFQSSVGMVSSELVRMQRGDQGAALLDAVGLAVRLLRDEPRGYRRAVLLLGETIDRDSTTPLTQALRLVSDTNTIIYAFGFPSSRSDIEHEASKFDRPDEPGPTKGCFSRDHTGDAGDDEYNGHYSRQVLDCISDLAPPIRFATMAWLGMRDSLHSKTTSTLANLTGGEFFAFHDAKDLQASLIRVSHDVSNAYVLSFRPSDPTPGLHALQLEIPNRPELRLHARSAYWIDYGH